VIRGLYLADRIEVDPVTRNQTLVKCFRGLWLRQLPSVARPFSIAAYLVNGFGEFEVIVRVERMDTLAEVYRARMRLSFMDRLTEIRFTLRIENCLFSTEGEHSVSLWVGGELLAQTPFNVSVHPESNS
jgi:hypothetical protein